MQNAVITIITPIYNRRERVKQLFDSLVCQTDYRFTWMIIDDGSTDGFCDDIEEYKNNACFEILYYYKENGGKHTALNIAFEKTKTELGIVVDSDDYLTPNAVETIVSEWEKIENKKRIWAIIFLKGLRGNETIGQRFIVNRDYYNDIDMREVQNISGDKAEVFRTELLKDMRFPVYPNEKFIGENYIWWQLSLKYDSFYVNEIIYIAEYLEGGLTKSGRKLRISCPNGGMANSAIGLSRRFPLDKRIKRGLLFVCYAFFANKTISEILASTEYFPLIAYCIIPGWFLHVYWRKKYLLCDGE